MTSPSKKRKLPPMGTNQYNHIGGIESGYAVYAKGIEIGEGHAVRREFIPWTTRHGVEWITVNKGSTAEQMLEANPNLNYTVAFESLQDYAPELELAGEHVIVVGHGAFGKRVLGTGSSKRSGIQPYDVADMADHFVEAAKLAGFDAYVRTLFALDKGKKFCCSVELGSNEWYGGSLTSGVFVGTSYNGSWSPKVVAETTVSQCTNTVTLNLLAPNATLIKFKNTKGVGNRWEFAKTVVSATAAAFQGFRETAGTLMEQPLTDASFKVFTARLLGDRPEEKDPHTKGICPAKGWDQKFDDIVAEWYADHNEYAWGTAWGALMAVNGFESWASRNDAVSGQMEDIYSEGGSLSRKAAAALLAGVA